MEENENNVNNQVVVKKNNGLVKILICIIVLLIVGFGVYICIDKGVFSSKDSDKKANEKVNVKKNKKSTDNKESSVKNEEEKDINNDEEYSNKNLAVNRYTFKDANDGCLKIYPDKENVDGYVVYVSDINIANKNYKFAYGNDFSNHYGIRTLNGKHIEGLSKDTSEMLPLELCVFNKSIVLKTGWEGNYTHVISTEGKKVMGFYGLFEIIDNNKIHVDEYDCSTDGISAKSADLHNEFDIDFNSSNLERLNLKQTYYNCDEQ